ncbi:MAG: hypothetical protein NC089_06520 [Bacteroides sp.]|nr:hypothetical protein [Bacteroides sp.]MCM1550844.1 hypothetical protein [Clostridium sp.]
MRLQWKLLLCSPLRLLLLLILFLGFLGWSGWWLLQVGEIWAYYGMADLLRTELRTCIYFFILVLFLAFDYFRELPDGALLEPLQASGRGFQHDCRQALVLVTLLVIYAVLFLLVFVIGFSWADTFTLELLVYFFKVAGNYILLNGMVAILLGWLLSRTVGRLLGYVCMILFACMVSPMLTEKLEFYVLWARGIYSWFRVFILMPEGLDAENPFTLYPVNLTLVSRGLFWIGFFGAGLGLYYRKFGNRKMMGREEGMGNYLCRWLPTGLGVGCAVFALIYSGLPASFYSMNDSLSASDSGLYDQWTYMIEGAEPEAGAEDSDFQAVKYELHLVLRRQLQAEVKLYPDRQAESCYAMTLYHLYQVDEVTDETGTPLAYHRDGDYLTVYPEAAVEAICISYHGGCANFYSNRKEVNLPGWFAYYPVPGRRTIYADYTYTNNTLEEPAEYDIIIDAGSTTIYSDLDRVAGNHFQGSTTGPTLLAGFVKEMTLENGSRCIYPYLDKYFTPDMGVGEEDSAKSLELLQELELGENTITFTPHLVGDQTYIYEQDRIVDYWYWGNICGTAEEGGHGRLFTLTPEELEAKAVESFLSDYYIHKETEGFPFGYDLVLRHYLNFMREYGYTEEDFEPFFLEHLGQEEWNYLKEYESDVED